MYHYCTACRSEQVDVEGGVCKDCSILNREPGKFAYHEVDGLALVQKTMMIMNGAVEALRDEVDGYDLMMKDLPADPVEAMAALDAIKAEKAAVMKRVGEIGRSVGMLVKEARAYEAHAAKVSKSLSKAQKMAFVPKFVASLTPEEQKQVVQQLIQMVNETGIFRKKTS